MLEIKNISKKYVKFQALKPVSLNIPEGKIVGLLGPNGSGKTTLLRILASELKPSTGDFSIDGVRRGVRVKKYVSALTGSEFLPGWMTIRGARAHYKDFYKDFDEDRFNELLRFLNLTDKLKVSELSKGMRSKLNLALTISRNARLIILDEPLDGVDPVAREEILGMIKDTFNKKSTILITSHLINELELLLNEVYFIKEGIIKYIGDAQKVREEQDMSIDEYYRIIYKDEEFWKGRKA